MPAETPAARKLWCIALRIKKGEQDRSYSPQAAKMADDNDLKTLEEFCHAKPLRGR